MPRSVSMPREVTVLTRPAGRSAVHALVVGLLATTLLAAALLWATPAATAADDGRPLGPFHVSPLGDDAGDGSAEHPWRTIAAATAAAPAHARIVVASGTYGPFAVTKPRQLVVAAPGQQVVVRGADGVPDVVRVAASHVTLSGITITGCVPDLTPPGTLEDAGRSDVRIDDGTVGVTLHRLTISDSQGTNADGLPVGCYGVFAHDAEAFRVVASDISGTGLGVYVNGGGRQAVIAANTIHDNTAIIRNTPGGDDDFGGNGVNLANVNEVPGVLVTRNTVTHNLGPSSDYGTDGGAFELYNASHSQIVANIAADNDNALETGSSPGGGCVDNVFSGNQISGRLADSTLISSPGLLLRCATAMVIDQNTLSGLDWWTYDIETGDQFSTDVNGLAITGNTVTQSAPVYRLAVDPVAAKLALQGNRFTETGSTFALYADGSSSPDLSDWQHQTGQDAASLEQ